MTEARKIGRKLPHNTPLIARLWHRSIHTDNGCYEWYGGKTTDGYGSIKIDGAHTKLHRAAYELLVGPIPEGLHLDHLCRNRACWNPAHLEPVTLVENLMRSPVALAAINSRKSHCLRGHEFAGENLRIYFGGDGQRRRSCETCKRERDRKRDRERAPRRTREKAAS